MKAAFAAQVASGTQFDTPLTDISDIFGKTGAKDEIYYAYVKGPDGALIELKTAPNHRFGHIHLFSNDPIAAGTFYRKYFCGNTHGRWQDTSEPRMYGEMPVGPVSSVICDNVSLIIFPIAYPKKLYAGQWRGRTDFESSRGHVVDHIGFSYDNLTDALEKLRQSGVKVTDEIRTTGNGKIKFAFIQGPDKIRIELIEGHAKKE